MATLTDPDLSLGRPVTPRTPGGCEECLILGSVQSFEPGEDWRWCYVDETFV